MTVALAVLAIGALIFVHELGHLLSAKALRIPVARFSIGMGPVILRRRLWGLEWALSAVPFGGYVLYDVEDESELSARPWASIATYLAGPAANVVVAICLYVVVASLSRGELAVTDGAAMAWLGLTSVMDLLAGLLSGQVGVGDLAGPVHIVSVGSDMVAEPPRFLAFLAFISLDLAVVNLLPIPSLDGGRILLIALQAVTRRSLPQRAQIVLLGGSFLLLAGLMAWVLVQDVVRLFS